LTPKTTLHSGFASIRDTGYCSAKTAAFAFRLHWQCDSPPGEQSAMPDVAATPAASLGGAATNFREPDVM
jgi:hypothetical protein